MRTIIPDTNVFLRFLLCDIPQQKEAAEKLFKQAKENKITLFIPQIVIFEIDFILEKYYLFPKEKVIESLEPIISTSYIAIDSRDAFSEAIMLYKKQPISFVDCFLIAESKEKKAELFTFDNRLQKMVS